MMSRLAIVVIGFTLPGFVCSLQADPSDIVTGYKDQPWGVSIETVQKAFPDSNLETAPKGSATLTVNGQPPAVQSMYVFMMDQLCFVHVTLELPMRPEGGQDPHGKKIVEEMIKEKYYPDEDARKLLADANISVHVTSRRNGTVVVMYENIGLFRAAQAAQRLAEQERNEKRRAEEGPKRQQALQDAGVPDLL